MKTAEEIGRADEKEAEIQKAYESEASAAQQEFNEVTKEEFERYEKVWHPAKERWEAFAAPHFKKLLARQGANEKTKDKALAEVRSNWQECPRCGTPAARYQIHCTNDKCEVNLILEQKQAAV